MNEVEVDLTPAQKAAMAFLQAHDGYVREDDIHGYVEWEGAKFSKSSFNSLVRRDILAVEVCQWVYRRGINRELCEETIAWRMPRRPEEPRFDVAEWPDSDDQIDGRVWVVTEWDDDGMTLIHIARADTQALARRIKSALELQAAQSD